MSKVWFVTGSASGLGRSIAEAVLTSGDHLVATARDPRRLVDLVQKYGNQVRTAPLDVADEDAATAAVQVAIDTFGRLDVVVNTVGGYVGGVKLWELEPKVFDQMLALNLRSGYLIARAVVPAMLKQRGGAIVNIASKAAVDHAAGAAAYAASKAAAVAMIDSLAAELKGTGVRANSILPSIIDTDVNRKAMPDVDFAQWPKPQDIARVVLFLCSDDAKLIHGAAIPVYGDT